MEYYKVKQQEKPETKQPTDKIEIESDELPAAMRVPENAEYADEQPVREESKKSLLARFIDLFVGSNGVKAAASRVLKETVYPSLTSLGVDFLENTLETMVYGTSFNRNNYSARRSTMQPTQGNTTPYNGMYAHQQNTNYRPVGEIRGKIRSLPEPMFPGPADADEFLSRLDQYIRDNGHVTVYQYLYTAGWPKEAQATDRNWGWNSMRSFSKRRLKDGGWAVCHQEPEQL